MIIATGSDILKIDDVKKSYKKMNWSFVHLALGPMEINVFSEIKDFDDEVMYLARRLAAKESIMKALPEYQKDRRKLQILNDVNGNPYLAEVKDNTKFHLTISDCGDYVMAVVVCERT